MNLFNIKVQMEFLVREKPINIRSKTGNGYFTLNGHEEKFDKSKDFAWQKNNTPDATDKKILKISQFLCITT